jgi:hypothetical protein
MVLMTAVTVSAESFVTMALHCDAYFDDGTPETKGVEFAAPIELSYTRNLFSASMKTAYGSVLLDPGDDDALTFSAFTDLILESSYTYPFQNQPLAGIINLHVNIPTGKEKLDQEQRQTEVGNNSDIFLIDDFGEGLNVGLTLGIERQLQQGSVGLYAGYTYKGGFDPTADIDDDTLDPGDEIFVVGLFDWQPLQAVDVHSYAGYSYSLADQKNGQEDFREGAKYTIGGAVHSTLPPFTTLLRMQAVVQAPNSEDTGSSLEKEEDNSNGLQLSGTLGLTYAVRPQIDITLSGDLRYYGESDRIRSVSGLPYEGQRVRYAVGPGFVYRTTPRFSIQGTAAYFSMNHQQDITQPQDLTYRGVSLELGANYQL